MRLAYRAAASAVRRRFEEQRPELLGGLNRLRRKDVAVFSGCHDSVEELLKVLGIGFRLDPLVLGSASIVFANCASRAQRRLINKAADFVSGGGHLVSTDWSLKNIVEPCFPGTIRHNGRTTSDEVVGVEPALDSLWADIVVLGVDPQWWLEGASYPIEILDADRVRVEAASHEMLVRYDAPAVAVRFPWGSGEVFHVVSHCWLQRSRVPSARHAGPCTDFLREGMRLSDEGIEWVLYEARLGEDRVSFAEMQSAATSAELVAQLCIRAAGNLR